LQLPQKCTGCAHLVDQGKQPRCADACPTGAIQFGEAEEFAEQIAEAEVMQPELGLKPRVYYFNLPKRFVAGAVYDPSEDECLAGAQVTLTSADSGDSWQTTTDGWGDFWFKKLGVGTYALKVEKEGFQPYEMAEVSTAEDINVGDIALTR
jgi:hypothetical protein